MTLPHRERIVGGESAFQAIYQLAPCEAAGQLGTIEMQQIPLQVKCPGDVRTSRDNLSRWPVELVPGG